MDLVARQVGGEFSVVGGCDELNLREGDGKSFDQTPDALAVEMGVHLIDQHQRGTLNGPVDFIET